MIVCSVEHPDVYEACRLPKLQQLLLVAFARSLGMFVENPVCIINLDGWACEQTKPFVGCIIAFLSF